MRTNCGHKLQNKNAKSLSLNNLAFQKVPRAVPFSNQFLQDLDLIWELRAWIPNP
jgi:hypothetical protein